MKTANPYTSEQPVDLISQAVDMLGFISRMLGESPEQMELSAKDCAGFGYIMQHIQNQLELALTRLYQPPPGGCELKQSQRHQLGQSIGQPPPGGCELKHGTGAGGGGQHAPAASGRL